MRFILRATSNFTDAETMSPVKAGDVVVTESEDRARRLIKLNLCFLKAIHPSHKKRGNHILVVHRLLYVIGGAETAIYNMARAFSDRKITFIFERADFEQALRIGRFCDVHIDEKDDTYEADVLICTLMDAYSLVKGRVKARKIYQQVHADWKSMKEHTREWRNFVWQPDSDIDAVVAVSETARKALKTAFKAPIASKTVRNIVLKPEATHRTFLSLTRLTSEKGAHRIVQMVKRFHAARRSFTWLIAATSSHDGSVEKELGNDPSVVFIKPSIEAAGLVRSVDYLVQLSDTESYCYSAHEALLVGTPVIGTRVPEFEELIKSGVNGYLVDFDLHDLDIDAIFERVPHPKPADEDIDPAWEDLLAGKL